MIFISIIPGYIIHDLCTIVHTLYIVTNIRQ